MKNILVVLALTIFFASCNRKQNQDSFQVREVQNKITEKHKRIPGTKVFMVIPEGFKISDTFIGIEKSQDVGINIMDIQGGNFESNARNFTKRNFELKGITVKEFSEFKLNGASVILTRLQAESQQESFQMVIGDSTFSTLLMALFPTTDTLAGLAMKNAMLSLVCKPDLVTDPFEIAKFTYDDKASNLKFYTYTANSYTFTLEGNEDSPGAPMLLISQLPPEIDLENTSETTLKSIKKYGLTDFIIESESLINVNGCKAYKRIGYGLFRDKKALVYHTLISSNKVSLMIFGTAKDNYKANCQEFEKITTSIKIK